MTNWLLDTLPPEAGPVLMTLVGHWDAVVPIAVALCLAVLLIELLVAREVMS